MKLTLPHAALAEAVAAAGRALPHRPPVPVLAGLLLTATAEDTASGQLYIAGFDYETSADTTTPANVTEPGRALVSGRLLADIARSVRDDVHLACDDVRMTLQAGSARFTLPTLPIEEYPELPATPPTSGSIDTDVFAHAVGQVAVAIARDDDIPQLTGIHLTTDPDTELITLAATDRYRYAVRTLPWDLLQDGLPATTALLPGKTLADTAKDIAARGGQVGLSLPRDDDGVAAFTSDTLAVTTRLLGGEFPSQKLLPQDFAGHIVLETAALIEAVKRVALVAERSTPIRLTVDDHHVVLEAGSGDDAQATEHMDAHLTGTPIRIAFNPGYLLDGLAALGTDYANLAVNAPDKPALLRGTAGIQSPPDDTYRYLLMPVRLPS